MVDFGSVTAATWNTLNTSCYYSIDIVFTMVCHSICYSYFYLFLLFCPIVCYFHDWSCFFTVIVFCLLYYCSSLNNSHSTPFLSLFSGSGRWLADDPPLVESWNQGICLFPCHCCLSVCYTWSSEVTALPWHLFSNAYNTFFTSTYSCSSR